jgi:hypothetical protein
MGLSGARRPLHYDPVIMLEFLVNRYLLVVIGGWEVELGGPGGGIA